MALSSSPKPLKGALVVYQLSELLPIVTVYPYKIGAAHPLATGADVQRQWNRKTHLTAVLQGAIFIGTGIFYPWSLVESRCAGMMLNPWTKRFMLRPVAHCRGGC